MDRQRSEGAQVAHPHDGRAGGIRARVLHPGERRHQHHQQQQQPGSEEGEEGEEGGDADWPGPGAQLRLQDAPQPGLGHIQGETQ